MDHKPGCAALDAYAHLLGDYGRCNCGAEEPAPLSPAAQIDLGMRRDCAAADAANGIARYAYILPYCRNWQETHDYDVLLTFRAEAPGREATIPAADLRRWNALAIWDCPPVPLHARGYGYDAVLVLWDSAAAAGRGLARPLPA